MREWFSYCKVVMGIRLPLDTVCWGNHDLNCHVIQQLLNSYNIIRRSLESIFKNSQPKARSSDIF